MTQEVEIKKKTFFIAIVLIISLIVTAVFLSNFMNNKLVKRESFNLESLNIEERFNILSQQKTNSCGGGKSYVSFLSEDGTRIQGSCCSKMVFHSYEEQIEGLRKYAEYDIIPSDPYDVSAKWAEEMIKYSETTKLSPEQEMIYEEAVKQSHEGGPCCCKCWHWYAYEGLAKHLIIYEDFTSEQIAEVWDLSDACGGSGHAEGAHGHG